jgi:hypothetical protein
MKLKFLLAMTCLLAVITIRANAFNSIEDAFSSFAKIKKLEVLGIKEFTKTAFDKTSFIEFTKNNITVQFGKYNASNDEDVYVFNYFADTSFNTPGIKIGCYKYQQDQWVEVTDQVLPTLSFNDFYGDVTAPPKSYANTVQFRFLLHKSNTLHIIIEPNMKNEDPKFDRIFDQRKYAAVQTKWNKSTRKFEITKWLK